MAGSRTTNTQAETRSALLEAAGIVFAERGYRDTTVREICQKAGANVAAVNYHFGDKETLYLEVLRHSYSRAFKEHPSSEGTTPASTPEQKLHAFVRSFLHRILDESPAAWCGRLLTMEMVNPTKALDTVVEERFRPLANELENILHDLLGACATPELTRLCASSVVSQCIYYFYGRPVLSRLFPERHFGQADVARLAEHITRFSLAGIAASLRAHQ